MFKTETSQNPSICWCNWWHTAYQKTRTENPKEDPKRGRDLFSGFLRYLKDASVWAEYMIFQMKLVLTF